MVQRHTVQKSIAITTAANVDFDISYKQSERSRTHLFVMVAVNLNETCHTAQYLSEYEAFQTIGKCSNHWSSIALMACRKWSPRCSWGYCWLSPNGHKCAWWTCMNSPFFCRLPWVSFRIVPRDQLANSERVIWTVNCPQCLLSCMETLWYVQSTYSFKIQYSGRWENQATFPALQGTSCARCTSLNLTTPSTSAGPGPAIAPSTCTNPVADLSLSEEDSPKECDLLHTLANGLSINKVDAEGLVEVCTKCWKAFMASHLRRHIKSGKCGTGKR